MISNGILRAITLPDKGNNLVIVNGNQNNNSQNNNNNNNNTTPLSGSKWDQIFAEERGENHVEELVEDIVRKAGEVVYERYIERRVVPFAVMQAKRDMLTIIKVIPGYRKKGIEEYVF